MQSICSARQAFMFQPWRSAGFIQIRTATKKAVGSTKNGRDSNAQYLGVKKFGGEAVKPGNIIVRQRGTKVHPGKNVYCGKDHTLHASVYGHVEFAQGKIRKNKMYVNVLPLDLDEKVINELKYKRVSWTKE